MKYVLIASIVFFVSFFVFNLFDESRINECMELGGRPTDSIKHIKKYDYCDQFAGW